MAVWSGLGVNYKAAQANWTADIAYFNSIGLNTIRPALYATPAAGWAVGTPNPAGSVSDINAYWRLCAQTFKTAGFYVTWGNAAPEGGSGAGLLTATRWTQFHDGVIAEATYLKNQGIVFDDFNIGNELEAFVDGSTITVSQLQDNVKQLATDIKAISGWNNLMPISYSTADFSDTTYASWISKGLGNLDFISIHQYASNTTAQNYIYQNHGGISSMAAIIAAFPGKVYVSEFGLEASNARLLLYTPEQLRYYMKKMYPQIIASGVPRAIVYSWVGNLNADDLFAMKNMDGSYNPAWDVLLGNKRTTFIP